MFDDFSFISESLIYVIFSVVSFGLVLFSLVMMKQISMMNRVLQTPYAGFITFLGFVGFCVALGIFVVSLFFFVPMMLALI